MDELALAVRVAVCVVLTEATVATNEVVVAPDATVTLAGIATALLLFVRATAWPVEGAAAFNVTVHVVEPAPVSEPLPHESALTEGPVEDDPDGGAFILIETEAEVDPCDAVNFADCDEETAATLAATFALVNPAATVTLAGTVTELLLLVMLTTIPPLGAGVDNVTVQLSVAGPVIDALAHESPDRAAPELDPLPCNFTLPDTLVDVLVVAATVSCPVESVLDPGLY